MRIIAGKFKGRRLRAAEGLQVRPTSDRLRETLFNILAPKIEDAAFLDLCAGSGAIGIEALSRGAAHVTFVESSRRALAQLIENLAHCRIDEAVEVVQRDVVSAVKQLVAQSRRFDLIFFDPPYASNLYWPVMELLGTGDILAPGGALIVEHRGKNPVPEEIGHLRRYREVRQGESSLSFFFRE